MSLSARRNPLAAKLERYAPLTGEDRELIQLACSRKIRHIGAREDIIREGDPPSTVNVILSGWACRYKQLADGRRQILAYLLPGDMCDLHIFTLEHMDHCVGTLTAVTLCEVAPEVIIDMTADFSNLARALFRANLVAEAIEREWIVNLGQRTAFQRIAHQFCELFYRLGSVGLTDGNSCEFPLTQTELADTTGLSVVHANRTLQDLRKDELIVLRGKTLTIPDLKALEKAALFTPNYLHIKDVVDHSMRAVSA